MGKTNLTKTLAMGTVITLFWVSAIYAANTNTNMPAPTDINEHGEIMSCLLKDFCSFTDVKKEILSDLEKELSYTTKKEIKTQIKKSLKTLNMINNEDKFYTALKKEYETINQFNEEESKWESIDNTNLSKKEFIKETFKEEVIEFVDALKEEVKVLVKDQKIENEVHAKIKLLNKIENEEKFFELLEKIYITLDTYYKEINIDIFDESEQKELNLDEQKEYKTIFTTEKKEILEILKEEKLSQDKIDALEKINNEDKFWEAVEKVEVELFEKNIE